MIRRKRPKRANLKPRKPVKRRNPAHRAANHERAYGEKAAWIRGFPCVGCGIGGPIEAAHTTTGGMGRKADASTLVPLCGPHVLPPYSLYRFVESCHRELHRVGIKTFEARHEVNLKALAAKYEAEWQTHTGDAT
jgi:hypothetical protein